MTSPNGYVEIEKRPHNDTYFATIQITEYYHVEVEEYDIDKYIEDLQWAKDRIKELTNA